MNLQSDQAELPELTLEAFEWLVRLRSNEMSEAETHDFAEWMSRDIFHVKAFAEAEDLFLNLTMAAKIPQFTAQISVETSQTNASQNSTSAATTLNINPSNSRKHLRLNTGWLALPLALAACWLFAVTLVMPNQTHLFDAYFSDYHTNTGEVREIKLADGSQLLLNTNTAVSVDYQATIRQITLHHGQARFIVAKETQRPFEVKSGELLVRALGTVFEVYNRPSDETSVIVQEHAVAARLQPESLISVKDQTGTITVQEGQQISYSGSGTLNLLETVDLAQTSAWQKRKISVNDRPLGELIEELNRYRVGRIFLSDTNLKNLRVVGVFSLDDPEAVLKKVCQILALEESRLGPWWILLHR
ncbi:FecR family protein [Methylomonas sp. AM2-LC]|uniref:FecR family protein n=1 Tax=Methylomonas sp. AM2-LC TaxID=3153301 RepID=UPI003265EBB5